MKNLVVLNRDHMGVIYRNKAMKRVATSNALQIALPTCLIAFSVFYVPS